MLGRVERLLEKQRKSVSERGAAYLVFNDPLWSDPFGPNWLAMGIYDRGRFWIDQNIDERRLRYDLRSLHGSVFCAFAALTILFFVPVSGGLLVGLKWAGAMFAWLYGVNVLLALARVPSAIRRAVRHG